MVVDAYSYSDTSSRLDDLLLDDESITTGTEYSFPEQCFFLNQQQQINNVPEDGGITSHGTDYELLVQQEENPELHTPPNIFDGGSMYPYFSLDDYDLGLGADCGKYYYQPEAPDQRWLFDDPSLLLSNSKLLEPPEYSLSQIPRYNSLCSLDPAAATITTTKRQKSGIGSSHSHSYYNSFPAAHYYYYLEPDPEEDIATYYNHNNYYQNQLLLTDFFSRYINDDPMTFSGQYIYNCCGSNTQMPPPQQQNALHSHQIRTLTGKDCNREEGICPKLPTAQSRAARERRRKISKKLTELGKLIPTPEKSSSTNGGKMNSTAEMLQAAFNYVKFLQAQVSILQLMENSCSLQMSVEANSGSLEILGSYEVQEKLYTKEKCLVPTDFLVSLTNNDKDLTQENPSILSDLRRLAGFTE